MALPAKDAPEEKSPYTINKALFEEASAIKDQMKMVQDRLAKMEEHRPDVSESVYFKVKTDYETQLDSVKAAFEAKCQEINNELKQLYQAQREQQTQLEGHQEILEEAKFRSMLGEYSDKKFKELEARQNKEISKYNEILNIVKDSIQQYEGILGHPFQPGAAPPKVARPQEPSKPQVAAPPVAKKLAPQPLKEEDTLRTKEAVSPPALSKKEAVVQEGKVGDELDMFLQSEGDYFTQESESLISEVVETEEPLVPETPATPETPSIPPVSTTQPVDDSISSILRDIPIEEEPSEVVTKVSEGSTSAKMDISQFPQEASLLLIEGDLDENEFVLSENTSIGRSPSNDVVLKENKVSRQHAAINFTDGEYILIDLKSSNGIFVNGKRVEEAKLKDGDQINIGSFKFQFNLS